VSEADSGRLPQPAAEESPGAPRTGDEAIDEALLKLADLSDAPLPEQHDRLAAAHQTLQAALDRSSDPGAAPPPSAQRG
jgi:hypothetical protein